MRSVVRNGARLMEMSVPGFTSKALVTGGVGRGGRGSSKEREPKAMRHQDRAGDRKGGG